MKPSTSSALLCAVLVVTLFTARGDFRTSDVQECGAASQPLASVFLTAGGDQAATDSPRLTPAQCAAGFALVRVSTLAASWLYVPSNAVVYAPWTRYGVAEDTFWLPATNWTFTLGTNAVGGVHVSSSGRLLFDCPQGSSYAAQLPDGSALSFLAPLQAPIGIVPPGGKFWHAPTASSSVLFTWQDVCAGRDIRSPVTFQAELFKNGDFTYRYAFTNELALTTFVIGAQHNRGGETFALSDVDRLANGLELHWHTFGWLDSGIDDHDGDGLPSYDEVMIHGTNPCSLDTDRDGLADRAELTAGTDPLACDSDGDGLDDGWETAHGLAPLDPADALQDHDGDGLSTVYEAKVLKTDPFLLDTDGDRLDDGLECDQQFALLVGGSPQNMSLTWAEPFPGAGLTPALAVAASKWDRTVLFKGGTAVQWRFDEGSHVAMEGVSAIACGSYQTLFIDSEGGALGQFYDPPKNSPFQYYEGSFGAFPLQVAVGGTFAFALLPDGTVTNIGAFADVSGSTPLAAPLTPAPTLTSIIPGAYAGNFVRFITPAAIPNPPACPLQIAAGKSASLTLGQDGTVQMWGRPYQNILAIPSDLSNVVKIAGGAIHSVALLSNGTVRAWGFNLYGQMNIPGGLSNVTDIACSDYATIALRADGSLAAWGGLNNHPQVTYVPASVSNAASVYACGKAGWALTPDGAVIGWGDYSLSFQPLPWKVVSAAFADGSVYTGRRGVALVRLGTDPIAADSDGDGFSDGWEFTQAVDPRSPSDCTDADANGMPDVWETLQFGSAGQDPDADLDGDGIPNQAECRLGNDPLFALQVITAAHGWHALAWNAFPGAASYVVTFSSGGQAVTTLVTTATSVTLNGRLPSVVCSATVTAHSASGQDLRTGAESWEQPVAGSGITAWKLAPAFAFNRPEGNPYTNVLTRSLTVNRTAEWDEFFLSSSSAAAGGWDLSGAALSWADGATETTATSSPSEDSLRLSGVAPETKTLGIRLNMPSGGGPTRCPTPLYLLRWSPTLAWATPDEPDSPKYVIATEHRATIASGGRTLVLPDITVSMAGYPHRTESPPARNFPMPADHPSASVTSATFTVAGAGVFPGPVVRPGEPGSAAWVLGSSGVPLSARPPSAGAAALSSGSVAPGPGSGLPLEILCVGHTIRRYWYGEEPLDSGNGICCGFPYGSFCGWDNLCGSGYRNDVSDGLSTHFRVELTGSEEVEVESPYEVDEDPESQSPLIAFLKDGGPSPYTLVWENEIILTGDASPVRNQTGINPCTNTVDSCGEGGPCGCENGGCGDEGPSLGSSRFLLKLGTSGARASDGALYFNTPTPHVARTNLLLLGDGSALVERDAGGISRVTTPLRSVTAADIPGGFRITVTSTLLGEDRAWEITNPDSDDLSRALFVKNPGGAEERIELSASQDGWWRLCELGRNGTFRSVRARRTLDGLPETVDELTLEAGENDPGSPFAGLRRLSHVRTVYTDISGYRRKLREEVWNGYAGSFETNAFTYVDAPGNTRLNGKPQLTVRADGSWEHLAYNSFGRVTMRSIPESGRIRPPATPATFDPLSCTGLLVTVSRYPEDYNAALVPDLPRETAEYAVTCEGTVPVSRVWNDYAEVSATVGGLPGVSCLNNVTVRAGLPSAQKDDPANPVTVSISCGSHREDWRRGLPVFRRAEDGLETHYRYEEGLYDAGTGSFTPASGGGFVRAISATLPPDGVTVPENTATVDIAVTDAQWGHTLLNETRLYAGGGLSGEPSSWPLLSWVRYTYEGARLTCTLHSNGTSESQTWGCCRVTSSTALDGAVSQFDAVPSDGWSLASDVSLAALPGSGDRFPAAESWTDALGRETNSVRAVWFNGSRDANYAPLVTRTEYPFGTDHYSVSVDPRGVATVTRSYIVNGSKVEETAMFGVTSRVTRTEGGSAVSEKVWRDPVTGVPAWTRETRETARHPDGCRAETVTSEASDMPVPVVTSATLYDYLGRVYVTATPLSVVTNFYANGRLVRISRSGNPDTLFVYDALGNLSETVLDADGDGLVTYAGADRITRTGTGYEKSGTDWYRVTSLTVWNAEGIDAALQVSSSRIRMTGLGSAAPASISSRALLTAQSAKIDWRGVQTVSYTYTDASSASAWQVTDTPESGKNDIRATLAGYPVSDVSATGVPSAYTYDGFARQTLVSAESGSEGVPGRPLRTVSTRTVYNVLGQVEYTEDAVSNRTAYVYDTQGRRVAVTDALANTTHTVYDAEGHAIATWGGTYPVAHEYDTAGRMVAMATTRDPALASTNLLSLLPAGQSLSSLSLQPSSLDVTRWLYDAATGLLTNKVYADGTGPSYTYTLEGRLATRTWARGVSASYAYDAVGQLVSVDYSDATPDVTYTYDRLGQRATASMHAGLNDRMEFSYTYSGLDLVLETQNDDTIAREYNLGRPGFTYLNPVNLVNPGWDDVEYFYWHAYDSVGQMSRIESGTWEDSQTFEYTRLPGTDLLESMTVTRWSDNTPNMQWTRSYEPNRDLLSAVSNLWDTSSASAYVYSNDALGRRVTRTDLHLDQGLPAMGITNEFCYNNKHEVTDAIMGTDTYGYEYDPIGNRLAATANAETATYGSNPLNQYTSVVRQPSALNDQPSYDADGNMTSCVLMNSGTNALLTFFFWDGENRLSMSSNATTVVRNAYDHQSRRIRKEVSRKDAETQKWEVEKVHTFIYDGWNMIKESVVTSASNPEPSSVHYYTWGLDLSGTRQGVGGVGGLLAVHSAAIDPETWEPSPLQAFYPSCDANGNVTAYIDSNNDAAAVFSYDAFGNARSETIAQSGNSAFTHFPYRFSSKYLDAETGLYYYGYRYYSPVFGRWPSRDPIGETGGLNIYSIGSNALLSEFDFLGMFGESIHRKATIRWAREIGIFGEIAAKIGYEDNTVDTRYSTFPPFTEQNWGWHFNRSLSGDSRLSHASEMYVEAKRFCKWPGSDDPLSAAKNLGIGLHPLQDWIAHGDYNTFVDMPNIDHIETRRDAIQYAHNRYQSRVIRKSDIDNVDDETLDANGANGMATRNVLVLKKEADGNRFFSTPFHSGKARVSLARERTKEYLTEFVIYVRKHSKPCGECQKKFLRQLNP